VASRDDDADYRNAVAQRQVSILFCRKKKRFLPTVVLKKASNIKAYLSG
jgi:hypothetical protein